MSRPKSAIPSVLLNVALPQDVHTQLSLFLYSDLEQRVPFGAYQRFLSSLIRGFFADTSLDLAPWLGVPPGAFVIRGPREAIAALERHLIRSQT